MTGGGSEVEQALNRPAPCVLTNSEYTDVLADMNRRLRWRPPKQRLAHRSGRSMRPISLPRRVEDRDAVEPVGAHAPAAP